DELGAVADVRRRHLPVLPGEAEGLEPFPAIGPRFVPTLATGLPDEIEGDEQRGLITGDATDGAVGLGGQAPLQLVTARVAHYDGVETSLLGSERASDASDLGEGAAHVVSVPVRDGREARLVDD